MQHPVDYAPSQDYGENPTKNLPADHWIIQRFGNYQPDGHTGTDYPCPSGTPVRAVTSGKVIHVGYYTGSYANNPYWIMPSFAGWCYVVDHGWFIAIYGHCLEGGARVVVGQQVAEGQVLGLSGNTGASTGDHLHFEILVKPFVLNSFMYGRANPAILFGGITAQGSVTPVLEEDDNLNQEQFDLLVGKLDELNAAHHVATREHVNGATKRILDREPLVIDRLDVLNTAHHVATREHVNGVRDGLLANFRATIDLLKPSADAGAVEAAEAIYQEVKEKLANVKINVSVEG